MNITVDALEADGWEIHRNPDSPYLAIKKLVNRNPLNNSPDSDIKLILHSLFNQQSFAIQLPDGGMLNFVANSMEQLQAFERAINFYDPPF